MPLLGLIGYPLAHSFSPDYFKEKFRYLGLHDWSYRAFPLENLSGLEQVLETHPELIGFNVTIPYKQDILAFCQLQSKEVMAIGAANCIRIHREANKYSLEAFNTDCEAWMESAQAWYKPSKHRALVLGSGGSSMAVRHALTKMQVPFDLAGRNLALNYGNMSLKPYDLVINCTPAGTLNTDLQELPLPYHETDPSMFFYDLVYNPAVTPMMQQFSDRGAMVKNGLEMLHVQAEKSWTIFTA